MPSGFSKKGFTKTGKFFDIVRGKSDGLAPLDQGEQKRVVWPYLSICGLAGVCTWSGSGVVLGDGSGRGTGRVVVVVVVGRGNGRSGNFDSGRECGAWEWERDEW